LLVATRNPFEAEGTYPLPEAQLDRFLFHLVLPHAGAEEIESIVERATSELSPVRKVVDGPRLLEMGKTARWVAIPADVRRWTAAVCGATRPEGSAAPEIVRRYVRHGVGPRAAMAMIHAARVRAVLAGRDQATPDDVRGAAPAALRHRVVLNFEGQAEGVAPDAVIEAVLKCVPSS
jgi:MoxR-like ATPase